jgi:hypothetical protein
MRTANEGEPARASPPASPVDSGIVSTPLSQHPLLPYTCLEASGLGSGRGWEGAHARRDLGLPCRGGDGSLLWSVAPSEPLR